MSTNENGTGTSTHGVHKEPPTERFLRIRASSMRRGKPPPTPHTPARKRSTTGYWAAAIAAVFVLVVLILALSSGGSPKPKTPTVTVTRTVEAKPTSVKYPELEIPPLNGISGVEAKVLLTPVSGATLRLAVTSVSHYSYTAVLITPPTKSEGLISNTEGRSQFIHQITIQHLLGYKYLRVYIQTPGARKLRPALQIETAKLAEGVISQQPPE